MSKITKYLNQLITGNVLDAPEILDAYSVDQSILKITPKLVVIPESTEDIQKIMHFVNDIAKKDIKVPVAIRGAGLDEMGADLTTGIVISTEKLNHLMEIDPRERLVRVQSGITLKELNTALSVSGLTLPICANENSTIGGLIATNPTDPYANKYNGIMNYIERAEIILANGECIQTNRFSKYVVAKKAVEKSLEGDIYQQIYKIAKNQSDLLDTLPAQHYTAGYPNIIHALTKDNLDLLPLFFGSEGTLGIISEVILRAVPLKKTAHRTLASFTSLSTAAQFLDFVKKLKPCAFNIYDLRILKEVEKTGKNLGGLTKKHDDGFAVFAKFDERGAAALKKLNTFQKSLPRSAKIILENTSNHIIFNEFENSVENFLTTSKNQQRIPLLSGFYIPDDHLDGFLHDLRVLEKKLELDLPLYGSFATSCYSLCPAFDITHPEFAKTAITLLKAGAYIIDRQNGSITGGLPEGYIKAIITNVDFSDDEVKLYQSIKDIFDPQGLLNPDIKLGADTRFILQHFRTTSPSKIVI